MTTSPPDPLQGSYDPQSVEARWYPIWERSGAFRPEVNPDGEPFCIVIPPPNVTGVLHIGHALDHSIQDAIIRRKRMQGYAALWLPGTDHAGIATQMVVERELALEGLSRQSMGRDAFVDQVWQWKRQSGGAITQQMRALGDSCDWTRERFTLDEGLSAAVREVFVRLHEKGFIYRGQRIINWSPGLRTAISDIEVEYREVDGRLVHITYPFADGDGAAGITVATTRAETMLGDTGVAVHPGDDRYRHLVGRTVRLPLMGRDIPVVADEAVDPDFGTGAVKVTPAHDPLDFEISQRTGLAPVQVIGEDGRMTAAAGEFAGLDRFEARTRVVEALRTGGYLQRIEEHRHTVGHCSRSGAPIEPLLSNQWFVRVAELVGPAVEVVREDRARFVPKRWERNYFRWMENLEDWCISRQLWWGHRIPAWYCEADGEVTVAVSRPPGCAKCGSERLRPEEDVLDTWFSSALWPFSTLGWPEETADLERFYPTDVLVTGYDIIFFWVARMLKMGMQFAGDVPFREIVIHGLVRASDGRKMSKSLNNIVDPFEMIEQYGADALRLSLLQSASPGHDVPFDVSWVDAARRFGNKLWNATKFALIHLPAGSVPESGGYPDDPGPVDRWILERLGEVAARFDELSDAHRLSDAFSLMYSFAWSEVFDWYLEMSKPVLAAGGPEAEPVIRTLGVVMRDMLKFFHPAIPFVTEELYSHLVGDGLLIVSSWPDVPRYAAPDGMETLQDLITALRASRSYHGWSAREELNAVVHDPDGAWRDWWAPQLASLAGVDARVGGPPESSGYLRVAAGPLEAYVEVRGVIDIKAEQERLGRRLQKARAELQQSEAKLSNPSFRSRAPGEVVAREEQKAVASRALVDRLVGQLEALGEVVG
ncbi:valine--tRNA ligase [Candidatus Spongiisocius sp.]|uniref:valine--tRNA ligase n=1 Tax=Candidatus Spongiisocius sp. TaxID=3101273 RepID=UPI003B5BC1D3